MRGVPRRRKAAGTIAVGAVLLIGAVVGFIVVPEHRPGFKDVLVCPHVPNVTGCDPASYNATVPTGPSRTLYDALRVTTWALVIVGMLVVAVGLIGYARREPPA